MIYDLIMFNKYLKHTNKHMHIIIRYDNITPYIDHLPVINVCNLYILQIV